MRTESVRVGRDATGVINPLTEALVLDRRQRLLDEATGHRRSRPVQRRTVSTLARTRSSRAARITTAIVFRHRYTAAR